MRDAVRLLPLLRPVTCSHTLHPRRKRFHQAQSVSLSLEALRSIFLSGLTLLHAVQLDNTAVSFSTLSKAIRAASNTMFLYAQSFPGARAYSEVFEELSSAVLDKLSAPNESSAPPPGLSDPAAATPLFQSLWDDIPSVMSETEPSTRARALLSFSNTRSERHAGFVPRAPRVSRRPDRHTCRLGVRQPVLQRRRRSGARPERAWWVRTGRRRARTLCGRDVVGRLVVMSSCFVSVSCFSVPV